MAEMETGRSKAVRRALLVGLVAVAAGSAVNAAPLWSRACWSQAAMPSDILRFMNHVMRLADSARVPGEAFSRMSPALNAAFDRLLDALLEEFGGPFDHAEVVSLLRQPARAAVQTNAARALVPLAVVRYLIGHYGVSFDSKASEPFSRFMDRYGTAIAGGAPNGAQEA